MIDDDTVNVVVTDYGTEEERQRVRAILNRLRAGAPPVRRLMRQIEPYTVSLWRRQAIEHQRRGFLSSEEIAPGLWEWLGRYDPVRGLSASDVDADQLVF